MGNKKDDLAENTKLDPRLARPRLKEGLVPAATGIFLRIEEGPGTGRIVTLSPGGVYLIGRAGADIALEDEKGSRKHRSEERRVGKEGVRGRRSHEHDAQE